MSEWTHVHGVIEVDTLSRTTEEAMYWTQVIVSHLPEITGRKWFGEKFSPYYFSTEKDKNCSSNVNELNIPCYDDLFDFQSKVLITIHESYADRKFLQTLKEVVRMLSKLGERMLVCNCLVRVQDDYGRKVIIDNPDWVINAEPTFWLQKYIKERYQKDECTIYF